MERAHALDYFGFHDIFKGRCVGWSLRLACLAKTTRFIQRNIFPCRFEFS